MEKEFEASILSSSRADRKDIESALLVFQGDLCRLGGDFGKAYEHYSAVLKISGTSPQQKQQVDFRTGLLDRMALLYRATGDFGKAVQCYDEHVQLARGRANVRHEAEAANTQSAAVSNESRRTRKTLTRSNRIRRLPSLETIGRNPLSRYLIAASRRIRLRKRLR